MTKIWEIKQSPIEQINYLSSQLNVPPLVARLLVNRGFTDPSLADAFLHNTLKDLPDPFLMKDMDVAIALILEAIRTHKKICIYGDYDVDGTVATSLLFLFFKEIGIEIDYYIPHRIQEGYSLNEAALQTIKQRGVDLVITVDNGISANQEALKAKEIGLQLIITDHHQVPPSLPDADAILNPQRSDCFFPSKEICGSGVAFYLMIALRTRLRKQGYFENRIEPNLLTYMDLLSIATVADVVPLRGVNRIFVKQGLAQMSQTRWAGLKALMEIARIGGELDTFDLGFRLGPRLNACGRLYDATTGVKLLTSSDPQLTRLLAGELDKANRERQDIEARILESAITQVLQEDTLRSGYVLFDENWHPGVIGIVASRLVERFCRPFVLLGGEGENLKGSARSHGGLNMVEALRVCEKHLIKYGGHKAAAGVTLKKEKFGAFQTQFNEHVASILNEKDFQGRIDIDAELDIESSGCELLELINQLKPFGQGNPEPVFITRGMNISFPQIVGEKHLKFKVGPDFKPAIAFKMGHLMGKIKKQLDMVYHFKMDSYTKQPIFHVKDLKI